MNPLYRLLSVEEEEAEFFLLLGIEVEVVGEVVVDAAVALFYLVHYLTDLSGGASEVLCEGFLYFDGLGKPVGLEARDGQKVVGEDVIADGIALADA